LKIIQPKRELLQHRLDLLFILVEEFEHIHDHVRVDALVDLQFLEVHCGVLLLLLLVLENVFEFFV